MRGSSVCWRAANILVSAIARGLLFISAYSQVILTASLCTNFGSWEVGGVANPLEPKARIAISILNSGQNKIEISSK